MRVGVWFDFRNPRRWRQPWDRLYGETLEQIELAESLGYNSVWFSEHHFTGEGYLPAVPVALAAAAAAAGAATVDRRQQPRLGTARGAPRLPLHARLGRPGRGLRPLPGGAA